MKYYGNVFLAALFCCLGFDSLSGDKSLDPLFVIIPTTVGDNSVVNAVKQYSDITQDDINKWKPFQLWLVGNMIRTKVIDKVKNYIKVCASLKLAHQAFVDEKSLRDAFPLNWTTRSLCAALKNLKEQGMGALALVAQVGINSKDLEGATEQIHSYITIIEHNRGLLKSTCAGLIKKKEVKETETLKLALDKVKLEEMKAKVVSAKLGIVQNVGGKALENIADVIVKGAMQSAPATLLGIVLYFASKFGVFNSVDRGEVKS